MDRDQDFPSVFENFRSRASTLAISPTNSISLNHEILRYIKVKSSIQSTSIKKLSLLPFISTSKLDQELVNFIKSLSVSEISSAFKEENTDVNYLPGVNYRAVLDRCAKRGHLGTWASGYVGIWAPGHLGTWESGHLGT